MKPTVLKPEWRSTSRICAVLFLFSIALPLLILPVPAHAQSQTVRVGYYENEVFQEGAGEGLIKNGYAYE